ncbi:hypothetical protein AB7M49_007007 [Bradyrhizobium elkanii]
MIAQILIAAGCGLLALALAWIWDRADSEVEQ